eukprot:355908-Chlamydomonas_euryale.AAC.11
MRMPIHACADVHICTHAALTCSMQYAHAHPRCPSACIRPCHAAHSCPCECACPCCKLFPCSHWTLLRYAAALPRTSPRPCGCARRAPLHSHPARAG